MQLEMEERKTINMIQKKVIERYRILKKKFLKILYSRLFQKYWKNMKILRSFNNQHNIIKILT